jgi:hypothetical protein
MSLTLPTLPAHVAQRAWQNVSRGWTYLAPCDAAATLHPELRPCMHNKTRVSLLGPEWTVSADLASNTVRTGCAAILAVRQCRDTRCLNDTTFCAACAHALACERCKSSTTRVHAYLLTMTVCSHPHAALNTSTASSCPHAVVMNPSTARSRPHAAFFRHRQIPFAAPGKLGTLHLKYQFSDVFADPSSADGSVFLPSFNEYQIGAHPSWFPQPNYLSPMGLERDAHRNVIFIDGFGAHRSRTIEPTVDDGGRTMSVLASCFRVMALVRRLGVAAVGSASGNGTGPLAFCGVQGEPCCGRDDDEYMSSVWSFTRQDMSATRLTANRTEAGLLRAAASEWREQCNPFTAWPDGDFCGNYSSVWGSRDAESTKSFVGNYASARGPFMLWTLPQPSAEPVVGVRACVDGFFGESCNGHGDVSETLGHASRTPSTRMPRRLRRCRRIAVAGDNALWYHTLDAECVAEDTEDVVVGYVL